MPTHPQNDIRRLYLYAGAGLVISQLVLQVLEVAGHDLAAEGEGGQVPAHHTAEHVQKRLSTQFSSEGFYLY
jgi:hypothetical protein